MPGFRRWGKSKFQKNPESSFKLLAALLVITLYLIIKEFSHPTVRLPIPPNHGAHIQYANFSRTDSGGPQAGKAEEVREAMRYTFQKYRQNAWGADDIRPVTGGKSWSRNGWGAFIVDSASTLALMELWDELKLSVDFITTIDFTASRDLVDPFETTIRYLGGLVSLVELSDIHLIPEHIISDDIRDKILAQAVSLANALAPAYDTPTSMPWPRVDLATGKGVADPPAVHLAHPELKQHDNPIIGPARIGSSILENRVLTRLTGNSAYARNATAAWAPLVWGDWQRTWPGIVEAPLDIITGDIVGRQRHWDGGHDSYYEYLLKMSLLAPKSDPYIDTYKKRFIDAAFSLRSKLATRSAVASDHPMQHLFIGRQDSNWYLNRQGHLACFAPGTILLGATAYDEPYLRTFALALLEGCRHTYASTPSKIGPESWSWIPKFGYSDPTYRPQTKRQQEELRRMGFWASDPRYKGRPEYVESLFYAWRITGQQRYRDWAWEAFLALSKWCKAPYGYAQLADVFNVNPGEGNDRWFDMQESFWTAETLKYLYLIFADTRVASLDNFVFSTEGHIFRMIR